ncbi:TetR/AcrR family transcriptional regulator [Actinoplanes subglobosus]|uniref:TetR/AcrR family transcriptional regulator n=1 Tax=Actinoplanes subglobosus TaxID=1547892 RepID=A0ABV8IXB0_9ACTN
MSETVPAARRGRPRDPDVEERVFDAAIELYGRSGWAGFNFEGVARASGIGKAALYRRWSNRAELLNDVLKARWIRVADIDTGDIRGDLLAVAGILLDILTGIQGDVYLRILMDTRLHPEVHDATADYRAGVVTPSRAMVHRAVARGELPEGTSPGLVIDLVVGAVQNHVLTTPPELRTRMLSQMHTYAEQVVDTVLHGIRH